MGTDIHFFAIKKDTGEMLGRDLYEGRNYEWFDKLSGNTRETEYDYLDSHYDLPDVCAEEIVKEYEDCYGGRHITASEFIKWYENYKPYSDAGWVTVRDSWLYYNKGIVPDLYHNLPDDYPVENYKFIEITNVWEPSNKIYNWICENCVFPHKVELVWFFDN